MINDLLDMQVFVQCQSLSSHVSLSHPMCMSKVTAANQVSLKSAVESPSKVQYSGKSLTKTVKSFSKVSLRYPRVCQVIHKCVSIKVNLSWFPRKKQPSNSKAFNNWKLMKVLSCALPYAAPLQICKWTCFPRVHLNHLTLSCTLIRKHYDTPLPPKK